MDVGVEFGSYRVIEHVGRGGVADVWSARDMRLHRTVAIKTLTREISAERGLVRAFEREARTIAALEHPHILPIYEFGEYDEQLYIVMRYLSGGSLEDVVQEGAMPTEEALRVARLIGNALDYAHSNHVIHLDIKPSNILLDSYRSPYLADFGLAAVLGPEGRAANPGSGTLMYMPPELLTAEAVDHHADIYSFGVMVYHMLTGELPFDATVPLALKQLQLNENIPKHERLPDAAHSILVKATAVYPNNRYHDLATFVQDLTTALGGSTDTVLRSTPVTPPPTIKRPGEMVTEGIDPKLLEPATPEPTGEAQLSADMITYKMLDSGVKLQQYTLEERLDTGERTRVYRAYDERAGRPVAIRFMNGNLHGDVATRFKREAQILGNLRHAHINPIYEFGTIEDILYIVTPYLDGGTLADRMNAGMKIPLVQEVALQLGDALDYIHSKGIIHRDLKTSNILFGEQDKAYIVDFGIAKILNQNMVEDERKLTQVGTWLGTPQYISPEQVLGAELTPAADQYALAVLVYQMVTGKPPFDAPTPYALMLKHVRDDPPMPSSVRADLPSAMDDVLLRALHKEPDKRFPNARAFAQAFAHAVASKAAADEARRGHVFISYSRSDSEQAHRLADFLRASGFNVWIDDRIEPSDSWWQTIENAIIECAAFVPIMSPAAKASRWVQREVMLADELQKPAFPILLRGERFSLYVTTQYIRINDDMKPPESFLNSLRKAAVNRR